MTGRRRAAGPRAGRARAMSGFDRSPLAGLLLLAPALAMMSALFLYPLGYSLLWAFRDEAANAWTIGNFIKAYRFYSTDIFFTVVIVALSAALIGLCSIAIAGFLTLGENRVAVAALRWLYRWPLFIPFVVAGQLMRTFLAKNGMMNNILVSGGIIEPMQAVSFLDWRGIIVAFVWEADPVRRAAAGGSDGHPGSVDHRGGAKPRGRAPARPRPRSSFPRFPRH